MKRIYAIAILLVFLSPFITSAQSLYFEPARAELALGDTLILQVRLDVDSQAGECVNVVDAVIDIPSEVQVVDTSIGSSILSMWVEKPTVNSQNQVTFAGGIPNGYCGRVIGDPKVTNIVAELVLRTSDTLSTTTSTIVEFNERTKVFLNDGSGTSIQPEILSTSIDLIPEIPEGVTDPWIARVQADTIPPEPFSISLERDPNIWNGDYFIVFNTTDKQTGIAEYQVLEEPLAEQSLFRFGGVGVGWRQAVSPYRLRDQTLNSTIRVKAIDKAGNERIATLVPDASLRTSSITLLEWVVYGGGLFFLLLLAIVMVVLLRRKKRLKEEEIDEVEEINNENE